MKLAEIAERINVHLKRLEADEEWNRHTWTGGEGTEHTGTRLWNAGAGYHRGPRVAVVYISYQGICHLSKAEALAYLGWLDEGNRGKHFEQQRLGVQQGEKR